MLGNVFTIPFGGDASNRLTTNTPPSCRNFYSFHEVSTSFYQCGRWCKPDIPFVPSSRIDCASFLWVYRAPFGNKFKNVGHKTGIEPATYRINRHSTTELLVSFIFKNVYFNSDSKVTLT